ncbi:hypothetical protein L5515_016677 [Caenorhabditis briggsae]|uniref:F-box domain-containing protein n=1 Tax=Caenorhabditis briggsae TaxID=6238 RepID=A0AAE9FBU8_CAEBR|nr:hypothetical protein L5515_016677 [Caenorhabditis briggsae]
MPVAFTRFPDLVQKEILDLMNCYDLFSFSETSKRSRSMSQQSAKLHEGNMKILYATGRETSPDSPYLDLTYLSTSHSVPELPIRLEFKDSKFEHLEKYLNVRHCSLFVNMSISMDFYCHAPLESAFLALEQLTQLDYLMEECVINSVSDNDNELIVRTLLSLKKAKNLRLRVHPTNDFKESFDFKTPFTESLENEKLEIYSSKWVSAWHVINVFNSCRDVNLSDSYFEESEVIEILKSWKIGSSIQYLRLEFVRAGSNEDFKAKMLEINAEPVPEAGNEDPNIQNFFASSSWSLHQDNSDVEVWITISSYPQNRDHVGFVMINKLQPENL